MSENSKIEINEEKVESENNDIESSEFSQENNDNSTFQPAAEIKNFENEKNYHYEEENQYENEQDLQLKIEASVRNGFIRKVYGILSIQLIITFTFVLLFQLPSIKNFILPEGSLIKIMPN